MKKPKRIANSTFYRNLDYRVKLECFLAGLPLKGGTDAELAKTSLPMAQAKIMELQIECSNLESKFKTLEKYIENSCVQAEGENSDRKLLTQAPELVNDFAQTARALALTLKESEGMLVIEDSQLVTKTRMTNQVVVNKTTLAPFLNWVDRQEIFFD